jgi:hypothetical protein
MKAGGRVSGISGEGVYWPVLCDPGGQMVPDGV